jgi:hypothetical protein
MWPETSLVDEIVVDMSSTGVTVSLLGETGSSNSGFGEHLRRCAA